MRKILFFFAVSVFAMAGTADAQIKIGPKAGMNAYTLTGDVQGIKSKVNVHFGGLVQIPIAGGFSIQPELIYSGEGGKFSSQGQTAKYNFTYLNVPVMAQYTFEQVGIHVEMGPQFGVLLSAKAKSGSQTVNMKDQLNGFNFSLGFGTGWRHSSGFGVGARYNLGLSNIVDNPSASIKSSGFQLSLSYAFAL
jgi:hypothetical protein